MNHPRVIDLAGRTFGRWHVLARAGTDTMHGFAVWLCRCACGVERPIRGDHLRGGKTRGCHRCANRETALRRRDNGIPSPCALDLTGQTFGRWTVLRLTEPGLARTDGHRVWICRCECGVERPIPSSNLRSGSSRGCGSCAKREQDAKRRALREAAE